jgi:hypothetical protein
MKRIKILTSLTALLCMIAIIGGCGATTEKWAYIHEPTKAVIALSTNGKATYKGNEYSYTEDGDYIILRNKEGDQQSLRYVMDGDKMTLYEESTYTRVGSGNGLVGDWQQGNGWSYVFTEDGKFSEESIFYGHYTVDEDNSRIKLMYDDPIEDAYLYYTLDGDKLTVAYPWPMVRVK